MPKIKRVIVLKRKIKYTLNLITVCLLVCIIFIGSGYLYLSRELKPAEKKEESVPYYQALPDNAGLLLDICGDRLLFYLNFEEKNIRIIFDSSETKAGDSLLGYPVNYVVNGDYNLLAGIIDCVGGVELHLGDETLRHTGVQVSDILSRTTHREDIIREIIPSFFKKIQKNGFQKSDFLYIIENSDTNLTVPECYNWSDYIKELSSDIRIIT